MSEGKVTKGKRREGGNPDSGDLRECLGSDKCGGCKECVCGWKACCVEVQ